MKVNQAEYVISAVGPAQYPEDGLPEIALVGRSNVGKSSLINKMIMRRNLARTSSQPGKTQTLNFYRIESQLYFVDLPGYGYAKVSKTKREEWGRFIEKYLTERERLQLIIQIIDLRHPPTANDIAMYEWMVHNDLPVCIVATKADKIPKGKWQKHQKIIKESLNMRPQDEIVLFSSEIGLGRDDLWQVIEQAAALQTSSSSVD
ncbi:MAG: GTP-binding protein [Paenibacillus sp.]|jgi:GTP-binding protein|nr:GTP-binding protein [Paenibacillus sp.]